MIADLRQDYGSLFKLIIANLKEKEQSGFESLSNIFLDVSAPVVPPLGWAEVSVDVPFLTQP